MKSLTNDQIEKLAARKNVRRIAVENFLGTLDPSLSYSEQSHNLCNDATSYRWNAATVKTIQDGITLAYLSPNRA